MPGRLGVTRFATASQDRAERAYLDTSKAYKTALKLLKQGDAATDAGDAFMSAAGFAIP